LVRLLARRRQQRRRAVGDLRGVAGVVDTVRAERRLERRQLLERGVADAFIRLDSSRQSLELHVDGRDLTVEAAFISGSLCLLVALERELVRLRTLDSPLLRYLLRRDALRRQRVFVHQR